MHLVLSRTLGRYWSMSSSESSATFLPMTLSGWTTFAYSQGKIRPPACHVMQQCKYYWALRAAGLFLTGWHN